MYLLFKTGEPIVTLVYRINGPTCTAFLSCLKSVRTRLREITIRVNAAVAKLPVNMMHKDAFLYIDCIYVGGDLPTGRRASAIELPLA